MSLAVVVPTLGRSPHLERCLEALREDGGPELDLIVVDQAPEETPLPPAAGARRMRPGANRGFAGGTNAGIAAAAAAGARYLATVNDDAVVAPGWSAALLRALEADPRAAAAQGVVFLGDETRLDGLGIGWNGWWQADQIAVGRKWSQVAPKLADTETREIFGASATAAIYRMDALAEVVGARQHPRANEGTDEGWAVFDPGLESYYEDVDLALRLRGQGWRAVLVPEARTWHAGSVTGQSLGRRRARLVIGNRYLVLARALGRAFLPRLPVLLLRDLMDLGKALVRRHSFGARGMLAGLGRAAWGLPARLHWGAPSPPPVEVQRFSSEFSSPTLAALREADRG